MSYRLRLEMFEGPLDLLLYLIKKNDVDVSDIPIAEITEQYLEYIEMMKILDLDVVGDFLVMAATLMQIKSKMLLPPDPTEEEQEEEDPRDELVRRLQEYQKFKEIADDLRDKEISRQDLFRRQIDEEIAKEIREDAKEVLFEATLFDLITALNTALKRVPEDGVHELVKDTFTVEQKIHEILHKLLDNQEIDLTHLFGKAVSREEIVVTFVAVLELIRLREIVVMQKRHFEDIVIVRNTDNVVPHVKESAE